MDLMQQTRATAILKDRVFAGSQTKHFLQNLHAIAYCPRIWKRSEVMITLIYLASIRCQPRELMARQHHIRIRLIISK